MGVGDHWPPKTWRKQPENPINATGAAKKDAKMPTVQPEASVHLRTARKTGAYQLRSKAHTIYG